MQCPYCRNQDTGVVDSRLAEGGIAVRRRRECGKCGKRFTTYERVEKIDLKVIKKDGHVEDYDRKKVKEGILRAVEKRPIDDEQIEELIDEVEARLKARQNPQVSSADIGRMILTRLKKLDKIAYLRFASVFLEFSSLKDFQRQLHEVIK